MAPRKIVPTVKAEAKAAVPIKTSVLPTKEANLFRQVLQQYEQKQWSKGIKTADSILKVYPDHGGELLHSWPLGIALIEIVRHDRNARYEGTLLELC